MANRARRSAAAGQLVVIGSSAGGIDALSTLVGTLPADFPAPIVLAQHLDPRRESHLAEILTRHSPLPVRTVTRHEKLEPGIIFAVPADREVSISDHEVTVEARRGRGPSPSVDRLLTTAAQTFGEGLIAVVLTGAGSDGAEGARRVKAAGGTVIIQDPETASFPSMPRSLAPTTVDVVADLSSIGPLVHELLTGDAISQSDDRELLPAFLEQVREATGVDFGRYKRPTITRRLHRRMVAVGAPTLSDYMRHVRAQPVELQRLANSFLIKVTEFFRDEDVYDYLRSKVFPDLIKTAHAESRELRLWSAGCATGEEAYSLAIIAAEAVAATGHDDVRIRIFATDVDGDAIEFARRGTYHDASLAGVPDEMRRRYFTAMDGAHEVVPTIRSMIVFGQHDLAQRAPFPRIDLAVCRNVLIYFTQPLQRRALELFAFSLRDDGYLVLGKSETVSPLAEHFSAADAKRKVYRRRGTHVSLALGGTAFHLNSTILPRPTVSRRNRDAEGVRPLELGRQRAQAGRAESTLLRLPVGVAVVGRRYTISSINLAARALLGVHGPAIGEDLVHEAQTQARAALRDGIDAAFRGRSSESVLRLPPYDDGAERDRVLSLTFRLDAGSDGEDGESVVLLVQDVTDDADLRAGLEAAGSAHEARVTDLEQQVGRLLDTITSLREANEELTIANAELRSANDDLVVSNEEVQAATEEVETLNEEMQATNEELETLNEELQATVEELNATNDDLESRSDELQRLALSLEKQRESSEAERSRLMTTLSSMADAVVVVDGDGAIVLQNEEYRSTFASAEMGPMEDEAGEPVEHEMTPLRRAARGETFTDHFVLRDADDGRRWFEARGRPIGNGGGAVVVIRDITERSLQRLQDEFVALLSHELRTPLVGTLGYLDLLARKLRAGPESPERRYADRALEQTRRFAALVDELFDASRLRRGRMAFTFTNVDFAAVVRETVALLEPIADGRKLVVDLGRADLQIHGDGDRLQQVVLNLVTNALRHAPESPRVEIRLRRRGAKVHLSVRDGGPGLEREALERLVSRLSEPSATRGEPGEGLGLGLYISHAIVEAHGGQIRVESVEGRGTTFTVVLPLPRKRGS